MVQNNRKRDNFDRLVEIFGLASNKVILFFSNGDLYRVHFPTEIEKGLKDGKYFMREIGEYLESAARKVDGTKPFAGLARLEKIRYPYLYHTIYAIAIEQQLNQQLININKKLDNIYEGLHRDRIAEIEAGLEKYFASFYVRDTNYKRERLKESISILENCRHKLIINIKADIQELMDVLRMLHDPLQKYFVNADEIVKKAILVQETIKKIIIASIYIYLANCKLKELSAAKESLKVVRKLFEEVGKNGYKVSRLLPYDDKMPPESIWLSGLDEINKIYDKNSENMCIIDIKKREVEVIPTEIMTK